MDVSKLAGLNFQTQEELTEALKKLFVADIDEYVRQCGYDKNFPFNPEILWVCLTDCVQEAGGVGQDYFFQDMWAAREIYRSNVKHVYDIGSRIDGFIAHLLAMEVNVTMLDIRPFPHKIEGLNFIQADAMRMDNIADNSMETVSALCSFEHFGLGRYSDPIDYDGWKKALRAVKRKMKVGGTFYLSVPVGPKNKVAFNAHRVFNPVTIAAEMLPEVTLHDFSYIANWKINTCLSGNVNLDDLAKVAETLPEIKNAGVTGLFTFKKHTVPPVCLISLIIVLKLIYCLIYLKAILKLEKFYMISYRLIAIS